MKNKLPKTKHTKPTENLWSRVDKKARPIHKLSELCIMHNESLYKEQ